MKRYLLIALTSLQVLLLISCKPNVEDQNILKIYVEQSGTILLDGQTITLDSLESRMKGLKTRNGTIYYSRDNPTDEPPKESMQVMQIIVKFGLPVKFFTDKTFTQPAQIK